MFELLASPLLDVPKHVLENNFINGLRLEIRAEVRMMKPIGLARLMEFAQWVED